MSTLDIIFADNHLLVVNKPGGLLTQPSGTEQDSLEAQAKSWIKQQYDKPGNVFLEAVHRLDKPVSGIVLFARTSKALARLQEAMREKQSKKIYRALVEGIPSSKQGTLEHYLLHGEHQAHVVSLGTPEAKRCVLHYHVLESKNGKSLLEIELETGRYHQIRAQLSAAGHSIIGDKRYGNCSPFRSEEIALQHVRLEIPHPITKKLQVFELKNPINL